LDCLEHRYVSVTRNLVLGFFPSWALNISPRSVCPRFQRFHA